MTELGLDKQVHCNTISNLFIRT